jgi:hypothetical protein
MTPSIEHLISTARHYWPSDLESYLRPDQSPEVTRLQERWKQELVKVHRWRAFLRDLGGDLPEFIIGDATTTFDASFRCAAYPPRDKIPPHLDWVVVGCVSILAPVYTVYGVQYECSNGKRSRHSLLLGSLPPEMQTPAAAIAKRIQAAFGWGELPREMAETPVALFVDPQQPPNTTLFHALFASQPERVP